MESKKTPNKSFGLAAGKSEVSSSEKDKASSLGGVGS